MSTRFYGNHFLEHGESTGPQTDGFSGDGSSVRLNDVVNADSAFGRGDFLIPTDASRGDGASSHYLQHELRIVPTDVICRQPGSVLIQDGKPRRSAANTSQGQARLFDGVSSERGNVSNHVARVIDMPFTPLLTKRTPASEAWKLVFLVLVFFIWVSTAGTLLFLYMDRYLFG